MRICHVLPPISRRQQSLRVKLAVRTQSSWPCPSPATMLPTFDHGPCTIPSTCQPSDRFVPAVTERQAYSLCSDYCVSESYRLWRGRRATPRPRTNNRSLLDWIESTPSLHLKCAVCTSPPIQPWLPGFYDRITIKCPLKQLRREDRSTTQTHSSTPGLAR